MGHAGRSDHIGGSGPHRGGGDHHLPPPFSLGIANRSQCHRLLVLSAPRWQLILHCEDVDLCLRFNREGLSNYIVHDSVVLHVKGASEGRKTFNDQNSELLLKRWKSQIRLKEAIDDQILHAENYIYRGLIRPFSTNLWKWIEAVLIYFRLKRL